MSLLEDLGLATLIAGLSAMPVMALATLLGWQVVVVVALGAGLFMFCLALTCLALCAAAGD